jgi:TIR domain-containing protein
MSRQRNVAPDEVLLSHSSKDVRFTRRLRNVLAKHGVGSFLSKEHIRGAQEWHDEIGEALKRCDWFLIVLSPHSARSKWVKHELIYALQANRYRGRIIPILYKTCDPDKLSWTLSAFQWIDFRKDFPGGCKQLLHIWKLEYALPPKIQGPVADVE